MPAMGHVEERLLAQLNAFTGFVRKRVADPDVAADIIQDSLAKALQHQGELADEERLEAWFYRIMRNTIIDMQRRTGRQSCLDDGVLAVLEVNSVEFADVCHCLGAAISTLKPEHAEALRVVDLDNVPLEQAAARLGISEDNLKMRRHRARTQLRQRLEETCRLCAQHGCLDCHCSKDERH